MTMSVGQWDAVLRESYELGYVLLELDDREQPTAAYQRAGGLVTTPEAILASAPVETRP
jgi:hypothetical protein